MRAKLGKTHRAVEIITSDCNSISCSSPKVWSKSSSTQVTRPKADGATRKSSLIRTKRPFNENDKVASTNAATTFSGFSAAEATLLAARINLARNIKSDLQRSADYADVLLRFDNNTGILYASQQCPGAFASPDSSAGPPPRQVIVARKRIVKRKDWMEKYAQQKRKFFVDACTGSWIEYSNRRACWIGRAKRMADGVRGRSGRK